MVEDGLSDQDVHSHSQVNRNVRSSSLSVDVVLDTESVCEDSPKDTENDTVFVTSPTVTRTMASLTLSPEQPPSQRKLILHFDARNTVFVADISSRITIEQALNTYLAGVVWGKATEHYKSQH